MQKISYLSVALILALVTATGANATAEVSYPNRPIEIVVAYPPGGGTDILARLVGEELSKTLGQPVVVSNRSGASGAIGTEAVARAPADGYTLLMATSNVTVGPAVDPTMRFDALRDFSPVTLLSEVPFVLAANKDLPVNSFADLVNYTRANAGKINYASTGTGSPQHLTAELLRRSANLDWVHVPYQGGGPALSALMGGHVQVMFSNVVPILAYLHDGRLKPLGVTTSGPLPALPDVPTMLEQGQRELVMSFWTGVLAPAGTPPSIIQTLDLALGRVMQQPKLRARLTNEGSVVKGLPSTEFAAYLARDAERWKAVTKDVGLNVK